MHRDVKLGLALAVLLIGSTTAFFFRDAVEVNDGLPRLQNPERLDAAIARRSVAPYLGSPEFDLADAKHDSDATWSKPAFLGGVMPSVYHRASLTPDPIQIILDEGDESLDDLNTPVIGPMLVSPSKDDAGERNYVVQPGDTLTGIAAKLLGGIGRYHELYELNRDRLDGPDSLRIGMTLRIPQENGQPVPLPHPGMGIRLTDDAPVATNRLPRSGNSPDAHAEPSSLDPQDAGATPDENASPAEKLFVPAKKPPFVPKRFRNPSAGRSDVGPEAAQSDDSSTT